MADWLRRRAVNCRIPSFLSCAVVFFETLCSSTDAETKQDCREAASVVVHESIIELVTIKR